MNEKLEILMQIEILKDHIDIHEEAKKRRHAKVKEEDKESGKAIREEIVNKLLKNLPPECFEEIEMDIKGGKRWSTFKQGIVLNYKRDKCIIALEEFRDIFEFGTNPHFSGYDTPLLVKEKDLKLHEDYLFYLREGKKIVRKLEKIIKEKAKR